jgi:hypothetical protein
MAPAATPTSAPKSSLLKHALDALRVERLTTLVEMAKALKRCRDLAQAPPLARLRECPTQALHEGHKLRVHFGVDLPRGRVSPFCAAPTTKRAGACFYHEKIPLLACLRARRCLYKPAAPPGVLSRLYGWRWVLRNSATNQWEEKV